MGCDPARAPRNLPWHSQLTKYTGEVAPTLSKVVRQGGGSTSLPLQGRQLSGKCKPGAAGDAGSLATVANRAAARVLGVCRSPAEALGTVVALSAGGRGPVNARQTPPRPTVSVVLPVFNRELSIGRAVQSVLCQTMSDLELVVVDDGSADRTSAVISRYSEPRLKLVKLADNSGPSAARNAGISLARGEYIAFLDSDDEWLPSKLELQVKTIRASSATTGISTTGFRIHRVVGGCYQDTVPDPDDDWQRQQLTMCALGPGSTLMVKRDVFSQVGMFDVALRRFEDWDWMIRCLAVSNIVICPSVLAILHVDRRPSLKIVQQSAEYFLKKHMQRSEATFGSHAARRLRASVELEIARAMIANGRYRSALPCIARAGRDSPGRMSLLLGELLKRTWGGDVAWALPGKFRRKHVQDPKNPEEFSTE
jgi:glycosyltransferase involved in cell wall biosynthesis